MFKDVTVGNRKYQIYPLTGRAALLLDRKVTDMLSGLFGQTSTRKELGKSVCSMFAGMDDSDFCRLAEQTLDGIVAVPASDGEVPLKFDTVNFWDHFKSRLDDMYDLMMQAWEAYELTPFARAKAGS